MFKWQFSYIRLGFGTTDIWGNENERKYEQKVITIGVTLLSTIKRHSNKVLRGFINNEVRFI